jgi:aspartyl-tRNA(Asn)/glutamyl-tRNA(Gln) amidotransferase subunit C
MAELEPISAEEVRHVARLARLELTDDEVERFTEQLGTILGHAADIAALDVASIPPTAHPFGLVNVLRDDVVTASLDRAEVLSQAPKVIEERFGVPRIASEAP